MARSGSNLIAAGALVALFLGALTPASAQPQPSPTDTQASQISPRPGGAAGASQIPQASGSAAQTGQISPASAGPVGADQLTTTMAVAEAPPPLSTTAEGRNAQAPAIHGHDRCDPAAGPTASQPACANILDQRGDQFGPPASQTARTADTDAPASGLVSDIVNGGTGTVVIAPTDPK